MLNPSNAGKPFPNKAGDNPDNDAVLSAELTAAGINIESMEALLLVSGEVKSRVIGTLHGWSFTRAWYYWIVKGPGIGVHIATALHERYGTELRVAGHCGCPSPLEWEKGFPVTSYHIDSPVALKALADAIKQIQIDAHDLTDPAYEAARVWVDKYIK